MKFLTALRRRAVGVLVSSSFALLAGVAACAPDAVTGLRAPAAISSVIVILPITATCAAVNAIQGVPLTPVTLVGSGGGGAPFTFTATGLPAGVTLSAAGVLTGTPTVSGTFTYSVIVKDKFGNPGLPKECVIVVGAPPAATCVTITAVLNSPITPVTMTGSGGVGGPYTFSATGLPAGVTMSSSGTISGTPTAHGTFVYTVTVTDSAGNTGTIQCSVTVTTPPVLASCGAVTAVLGIPIAPTMVTVPSGGVGMGYTFSATGLPAGLTMSANGTLSGTPTASGTFSYTVTVTDAEGNTGTVNCTIVVSTPPVTGTCVAISAVQGNPIVPVTMAGSGGVGGPYTFSASGLPSGLTMSSSGTISGTPTVSGTFTYTVTITDSAGNSGSFECSVTVNAAPSATCVAISAVVGTAITPVTMTGTGGVGGPYTFSATGLPAGVTMSSSGTISGTPTASGTFAYTVTITDSAGNTGTVQCSVTVNAAPSTTCVAITAVIGRAITPVTLTGAGGVGGPYSFTASGLPAGLAMSASGTISGTPTVSGSFTYTVTVTDAAGNSSSSLCSVTVLAAPTASCIAINAVKGTALTPVTMVGSGGAGGPYTFSATGLPAGVVMSAGGTISGTPTATGTFSYTVTITDSAGNTGSFQCSITVSAPPPAGASCGYTQGYWKNHEEKWPAPYSPTAQWLSSTNKVTGVTWDGLMGMSVTGGNSYMQLAHQWIAATLNKGTGAPMRADVLTVLNQAGAWLVAKTPGTLSKVPNIKDAQATAWAAVLDNYNNGRLGTPHCD